MLLRRHAPPKSAVPKARGFGNTALRGVAITLLALAGGALGAASASADNQAVQITDLAFVPAAVAVKPGETVTWNFAGGTEPHNVTFEDGSLRHPPGEDHDLSPWSTSKTFAASAAGMYRYFCDHHGSFGGVGMAGVVHVNAAGELPGAPPTATFSVSGPAVVGEPVTFSAAGSNDPDPLGSIIRYEWDLDNDGKYDLPDTPPTVDQTFTSPGERTVRLRVTDKDHRTTVTTRTLTVEAPAPPPPPPPPPPVAPPPPPPLAPPPPPPPPPPPAAPAADDVTPPALSALAIRPSSFRAGTRATVRYRLSEDATVTFTAHRIDKGRRRGSSCRRPSSANRRGASCSRYVRMRGSLRDTGAAAGTNSVRFTGRLAGRRLKAGRYRLTAVARDDAGNVATARSTTFVIRR